MTGSTPSPASPARPDRAIKPGIRIGGCDIVRVLATHPGEATVVEAIATGNARVVLTLLAAPFVADGERLRRTRKLAGLRASLAHQSLAPYHGVRERDGYVVLVGEYPGPDTLDDRLAGGPLAPAAALRVLARVAAGLQVAAAKGLVHRELTPAAIALADDRVLLGDFAITRPARAPGTDLVARGIACRSPEELRGEAARTRSNVYSLGCILTACLTGAPPFAYDRPLLTLHAHLVEPPPRISERVDGLPPRIDEVVARALAKDPRERFASPAELADAASRALGAQERVPVEADEQRQRAHERARTRDARRARRRAERAPQRRGLTGRIGALGGGGPDPAADARHAVPGPARSGRQPAAGRAGGEAAAGARHGARTRAVRGPRAGTVRRASAPVLVGIALLASATAGFATGSGDGTPDRRQPVAAPPERQAAAAAEAAYVRRVGRTVERLDARRDAARRRLRAADTPAGQSAAARRLARAFGRARVPDPPPGVQPATGLGAALTDARDAYRRLAAAARTGDRGAWRAARRDAVRAERAADRALRAAEARASGGMAEASHRPTAAAASVTA